MRLGKYLKDNGITQTEFASRIGAANTGVVSKYIKGGRIPRARLMEKIIRETGGEVQANDFFADAG